MYATVGVNFSAASSIATVYRFDAVTGAGGLFIPNEGTNEVGVSLWKFQLMRGIATDDDGNVWVSDRSSNNVFKFSGEDGSWLQTFSGLSSVQPLVYSPGDKKVYGGASNNLVFTIDTENGTATTTTVPGIGNRLGITMVQGMLCSGRWDTPEIAKMDLNTPSWQVLAETPKNARQLITLPRAPLRETLGHVLISETDANRVTRATIDAGGLLNVVDAFAGAAGAIYGGTPLRQPRGLATYSNMVYIAEGVVGGRILRFNKWGTFKEVVADFSASPYTGCVPTALDVSPDGQTLYVSDAHTLFITGANANWANVPGDGYYATRSFGETIYKVQVRSNAISIFANADNCAPNFTLLECHGIAVDDAGRVHCTAWFNRTNSLNQSSGTVYAFAPDGTRLATRDLGNPTACYYDRSGTYVPAAADPLVSGPGLLFTGNGMQDFWWSPVGESTLSNIKVLDLGNWRNYLDIEIVNGRFMFTDPEYSTLWLRTGEATRATGLTGLVTPSYLTFVPETGEEPPPVGTVLQLR